MLSPAFYAEVSQHLTPTLAGLLAGVAGAVLGFAVVALVAMRRGEERTFAPTVTRAPFVPSNDLSARALVKMRAPESDFEIAKAPMSAVTISPIVFISAPMISAPMIDALVDDSPTEISETFFDVPPQPRTRGERPKIRAIAPAAPRFVQGSPPVIPPREDP